MRLFKKFIKARDGLAAIEFAFIAPVMLTMFFGTVELCNALICRQKVTNIAATAADLVAQDSQINDSQLQDVFSALDAIIYPYPTTHVTITITSITQDSQGNNLVVWSKKQVNGTYGNGYAANTHMTVPTGVIASGGSVIFAEISYTYNSSSTQFLHSPITMLDSFYSKPRKSAQVTYSSS